MLPAAAGARFASCILLVAVVMAHPLHRVGKAFLAAAPTFVVMALWLAVAGGPAEMMCSSGGGALSLNGMAAMYTLMSVFHVSPWLTLLSNWRNDDGG